MTLLNLASCVTLAVEEGFGNVGIYIPNFEVA